LIEEPLAVLLNVFLSQHAYLLFILPKSAHVRRQQNNRRMRQVKTIVGASRRFSCSQCSLGVVLRNLLQRFVAMTILFNPTRWFLIAALVGHGATRKFFFRIAPKHYLAVEPFSSLDATWVSRNHTQGFLLNLQRLNTKVI
jgi:hypothetical protein